MFSLPVCVHRSISIRGAQLPFHLFERDGRHFYRRSLRLVPFFVDVAGKRREEGAEQLLGLLPVVGRSRSIRSAKRWDCPKRLVARLQVLGRVPDVVVVRQEVIPVLSLLLSNGIMVLL